VMKRGSSSSLKMRFVEADNRNSSRPGSQALTCAATVNLRASW
jgi:hypothetical protein